ncbi:hypothetical protein [Limimaricola soesokkakensis]|uniref:hypothetical protein n=1 Tax=Limimaricola soesokkakensis TaxID=1343159 RepID=UPI003512A808
MPTYTIAIFNRMILACALDDLPDELARRIWAAMRPLSFEMQVRIKDQLVHVAGVTLFADDKAALRAGALSLWHARPGALEDLTDAEGKRAKVAARLGGGKRRKKPAMGRHGGPNSETNQNKFKAGRENPLALSSFTVVYLASIYVSAAAKSLSYRQGSARADDRRALSHRRGYCLPSAALTTSPSAPVV